MAYFSKERGLVMETEDKEIMAECTSFVSAPKFDTRRLNLTKNIPQAIEECFIGWEVK